VADKDWSGESDEGGNGPGAKVNASDGLLRHVRQGNQRTARSLRSRAVGSMKECQGLKEPDADAAGLLPRGGRDRQRGGAGSASP
jgi:hypothetical protein